MTVRKIVMPQGGQDLEVGTVREWLKQVGDPVKKGEPVVLVETEKISLDVVSPGDGFLRQILAPDGSRGGHLRGHRHRRGRGRAHPMTDPGERGAPAGQGTDEPSPDIRPLNMIRRVVARKMTQAAQTIPAVTLHRDAQFGRLLHDRSELGATIRAPPATGRHPRRHRWSRPRPPRAAQRILGRDTAGRARPSRPERGHRGRHPGGARRGEPPRGGRTHPRRARHAAGEMVTRALAGRVQPDDVSGATFTITNLGGPGHRWLHAHHHAAPGRRAGSRRRPCERGQTGDAVVDLRPSDPRWR